MAGSGAVVCQLCGRSGPGVALCGSCLAIAVCQDRHKRRTKQHGDSHECERMQTQLSKRVRADAEKCTSTAGMNCLNILTATPLNMPCV